LEGISACEYSKDRISKSWPVFLITGSLDSSYQFSGSGSRIRMFLCVPDPVTSVRDRDPDPFIIKQK